MNLAMQAWHAGDAPRVLELLEGQRPKVDQDDLRGFEWFYLWRLCNGGRMHLKGHTDAVLGLSYSPDGKTLASASADGTVRLWDTATGRERMALRGHAPWDVVFSPDGKILASGGKTTNDVILWNATTGKPIHTIPRRAYNLEFSPDGGTLLGGGSSTQMWDVASGAQRATFPEAGMIVGVLPDRKTIVTLADQYAMSGEVRFWDSENGKRRLTIPAINCHRAVLSPDGTQLAICGVGPVTLWDTATGKRQTAIPERKGDYRALAFSPDGKTLAVGGEDRTVAVWDLATGRQLGQEVHLDTVWAVAFSPDGKSVASATLGGAVTIWDLTPPEEATTIHNSTPIKSLRFSSDSNTLMVGGNPTTLLDVATGKATSVLPVTGVVAASADGNTVVRWNKDDAMNIWDLRAGRQIANIPEPRTDIKNWGLSLSPDGKMVATFCSWHGDSTVKLWEIATQQSRTLTRDRPVESSVLCAAFSPDAKLLAAGFQFQSIVIWDVATGKVKLTITQPPTMMTVHSVAFSPNGKTLAVGASTGAVTLWEVETGMLLASFRGHTATIFCLAFSPDGKTLATAGVDTIVRLWDVATGQERVTLKGHTSIIVWATFAPDGNTLATAGQDGTVRLWRASQEQEATAFRTKFDPEEPGSPAALLGTAHRLKAAGRAAEAKQAYKKASAGLEQLAAAYPKMTMYRQELGGLYRELGQWEKATVEYTNAIELKPDVWEVWSGRAFAHFNRQQWDKAIFDFSKAIDLAPGVHTNWFHRGYAHLHLMQWDKAAADFTKIVEGWPAEPGGWYLRAQAYAQLNQPDKALADLRLAIANGFDVERIKNNPNFAPIRSNDDFQKLLTRSEDKED